MGSFPEEEFEDGTPPGDPLGQVDLRHGELVKIVGQDWCWIHENNVLNAREARQSVAGTQVFSQFFISSSVFMGFGSLHWGRLGHWNFEIQRLDIVLRTIFNRKLVL